MKYGEVELVRHIHGRVPKQSRTRRDWLCEDKMRSMLGADWHLRKNYILTAYDRPVPGRRGRWIRIGHEMGRDYWDIKNLLGHTLLCVRKSWLEMIGIEPIEDTWFWVTAKVKK